VLTIFLVGAFIMAINFVVVPGKGSLAIGLFAVSAAALIAFFIRERRAGNPIYDLHVASRRTFWVAAVAGIIVFGSLMGSMYIGQQFLQNVLGYSTVGAGAAILPAAVCMVLVAPRSANLVESKGARVTLLLGYVFVLLGFLTMLLLWKEGIPYWKVGLGYSFVGVGVGLAGTPASHSLTGSVPVTKAGMASGTADLQRDLGGAILQSIMGAFLTAGYAAAASAAIASSGKNVSDDVQSELTKSFSSASNAAKQYSPSVQDNIVAAAKASFLKGDEAAYLAGIVAVMLGAVVVFFLFPKNQEERRMLAQFAAEDAAAKGKV
jgi:DHA2 family multidrug resistance protein-like MFS transporter